MAKIDPDGYPCRTSRSGQPHYQIRTKNEVMKRTSTIGCTLVTSLRLKLVDGSASAACNSGRSLPPCTEIIGLAASSAPPIRFKR